ncbi:MAG: radical SAM protein, partial [Deltaproteobacteria bacterium]|nr:radical SAM protein [Deltaproteobacteria bacterium]
MIPMKWIELILSFECNCRCLVCPASLQPASAKMSSGEIDGWLEHGLSQGAEGVWFGGGEPTLHPDLIASIERARQLGYVIRKIQTNGLRFAYQPFTKRCLQAGANQFSMSIKGPDAKTHDGITQNPGSFVHLTRAVENLVAQSAKVEADILITKENLTGWLLVSSSSPAWASSVFIFGCFRCMVWISRRTRSTCPAFLKSDRGSKRLLKPLPDC